MMSILSIVKNNFIRAINKKYYVLVTVITSLLPIVLAVLLTSKMQLSANIAYVGPNKLNMDSKYISVTNLSTIPKESELVSNRYDAVVINKNGKISVDTIKNNNLKNKIENAIMGKGSTSLENDEKRGVGTNILGYLLMFMLINSIQFMSFFVEDKYSGNFKRIVTSDTGIIKYMTAYWIFDFLMNFTPAFVVIVCEKEIFGVNVGFSIVQYIALLSLMAFIGVAFSLFMCSFSENHDDCVLISSVVAILTSLLSGSMGNTTGKNYMMNQITKIMPQKNYMTIISKIENGKALQTLMPYLYYVTLLSIVMIAVSGIVCRIRFNEGKY